MNLKTILDAIAADAEHGDIVFPTHAEIALRVQRMVDDPNCSVAALGKLVGAEPMLAARVLAVANSIACNPSGRAVSDPASAITRIGFATLRAIAAAVVVRQMRELSPLPAHRALAAQTWEHTAHVAALARVLARQVTRQNPDAAFFAGIVHEVGSFYLIARAAEFPGLLDGTIEDWHGEIEGKVGRAVLRALDVPPAVVEAIETLWAGYLALPPHSLGDTLLLADELVPVETPLAARVGASRKGMPVELEMLIDDETLTAILAESAAEVESLRNALNA